jgi:Mce-associated membrane protein
VSATHDPPDTLDTTDTTETADTTGTAGTTGTETASGDSPVEQAPGLAWRVAHSLRGPRALLVLAVVLVLLGSWYQVRAAQERTASGAGNQALLDSGRTSEVSAEVSDALNRVFSYAYDNTAVTRQASQQLLTGAAAGQYASLFAQVELHAAAQKLTVTTRVVSVGVTRLVGDTADLLVFLDQSTTSGATGQGSASAAQLSVTAQQRGSHWLITDIQSR